MARGETLAFSDFSTMFLADKSCALRQFFCALDFLRVTEEFKTAELQRYLKCGYDKARKTIDALIALSIIEKIADERPSKYKRIADLMPLEKNPARFCEFQKIPLEKALESEEFKNSEYGMPIIIGYDEQNNLLIDDLSRAPHILVGGMSGSGKSIFLQNIITCLTSRFTEDAMRLALFDLKRGAFGYAKNLPHLCEDVVTDAGDAIRALEKLVDIMNERRNAMQSAGVRPFLNCNGTHGIDLYNAKYNLQFRHIAVIFDEYAELATGNTRAEELILKLLAHGHGVGMHLILASQRASDEIFPSVMRAIAPTRAAFRAASAEDSRMMLGSPGAENLPHYFGEMMYSSIWLRGEPIKVKVPYISEKKMLTLVKRDKDND